MTMKKRVTIYVADGLWKIVKRKAFDLEIPISQYVIDTIIKSWEAPQEIKGLKDKTGSMGGFVKKDGTRQPETNTQFSALTAEWVDQYFKPMPKKVKK